MDAALLLALILLNGVFATSEIALLSSRRIRLQQLAVAGDRNAEAAIALGEDPTRFLSALQIGITAIGVLNGIIGEATFSEPIATIVADPRVASARERNRRDGISGRDDYLRHDRIRRAGSQARRSNKS